MYYMMNVLKAVADESRVRILMALRNRELCVCQLTELLQLAQSTISKHMAILKQARLVEMRKQGRWIFYRLAGEDSPGEAQAVTNLLVESLRLDKNIREDEKQLRNILKTDPEELCRRQARGAVKHTN